MPSSPPSRAGAIPGRWAVAIALSLVYVVWGSTYLAIRFGLEGGYPPLLMVSGARFICAGTAMYIFLRWRGVASPTRSQWKNVAWMGFLLLTLGNGLVTLAEKTVSSGITAVAIGSMPLWMTLFASLRGHRSTKWEWLGTSVGFTGVLWLNAGSSLTASPAGLVLLIIAPVAWAYGSMWSQGRDLPAPFMTAATQMLCGSVFLMMLGFLRGENFSGAIAGTWTLRGGLAIAYLAIFGSIVAFSAYIWLLNNARPALIGSYAYINPVIAVSLGVWLGDEVFTAHDLGAMAVILAGVIIITFNRGVNKK